MRVLVNPFAEQPIVRLSPNSIRTTRQPYRLALIFARESGRESPGERP
jgi:hypothetical protein